MEYSCKNCGETRFFYTEVSIAAKQRIDLKNGPRHKRIYDVDPSNIDGFFEDLIYCAKCEEQVDMELWKDYRD